eukprot:TRINITY_DN4322_c0_g2_i2.p1 TRINITY_DN4322_c0_g2~~TRINITY_DN4322_c0_g2_i2.p1  ORF type:complete len:703 (+),score=53.72 TRINITY_DN4322_c0_g2_i2:194-2302(+)
MQQHQIRGKSAGTNNRRALVSDYRFKVDFSAHKAIQHLEATAQIIKSVTRHQSIPGVEQQADYSVRRNPIVQRQRTQSFDEKTLKLNSDPHIAPKVLENRSMRIQASSPKGDILSRSGSTMISVRNFLKLKVTPHSLVLPTPLRIYEPEESKREAMSRSNSTKRSALARTVKNAFRITSPKQSASLSIERSLNNALQKDQAIAEFYKFTVVSGNNSGVIRRVLSRRPWWKEITSLSVGEDSSHFIWYPTSGKIKFDRLRAQNPVKQTVNHFEFHREISMKHKLFKNLQVYCEANSIHLHELTPASFVIELDGENQETDLQNFSAFFQRVEQDNGLLSPKAPARLRAYPITCASPQSIEFKQRMIANRMTTGKVFLDKMVYCQQKIYPTFYKGQNLWLVKPCEFNRGRGIRIINSLQSFKSVIHEYVFRGIEDSIPASKTSLRSSDNNRFLRSHNLVVQKYIESPLLIEGRKFDVRVWVLVDHEMNLYFFKEGYIRTSSEAFQLNAESIDNQFIHLTNNAVQKHSDSYGKFESGNQLPLSGLGEYLKKDKHQIDFNEKIVGRIKELIKISMNACKNKLNANERRLCFELFGYDFIIDSNLHVWLIEVNTNPCIEESSPLLKTLIPRMLDDAMRLTIDQIYPTHHLKQYRGADSRAQGNLTNSSLISGECFSVPGYSDDENIWELLDNLSKRRITEFKPGFKIL